MFVSYLFIIFLQKNIYCSELVNTYYIFTYVEVHAFSFHSNKPIFNIISSLLTDCLNHFYFSSIYHNSFNKIRSRQFVFGEFDNYLIQYFILPVYNFLVLFKWTYKYWTIYLLLVDFSNTISFSSILQD